MFKDLDLGFGIVLLFLAVIMPFSFYTGAIDAAHAPRLLTYSICMLAVAILNFNYLNSFVSNFIKANKLLIGLLGCYILATIFSYPKATSYGNYFFELAKMGALLSGLFIFLYLKSTQVLYTHRIALAVTIMGVIGLLYGFYQLTILNLEIDQASSFFANKNLFSSLILLGIPFWVIALKNKYAVIKGFGILNLALAVFILLQLETRAVWLALSVEVVAITLFYILNRIRTNFNRPESNKFIALGAAVVVVVSIVSLSMYSFNRYEEFKTKSETQDVIISSSESRLLLNAQSITMIMEQPIQGVGLGNWKTHFPKYGLDIAQRGIEQGQRMYQRAHNDFIQTFAELGIIGGIAFAGIFIVILYHAINNVLKNQENFWFNAIVASSLLGIMVVMLFDFPKERIEHNVLMMLLFSFVYPINNQADQSKKQFHWFNGLLLVAFCFGLVGAYNQLKGEVITREMYVAKAQKQWKLMYDKSKQAKNLFYDMDPQSHPLEWYAGVAMYTENKMDQALVEFLASERIHPNNINILNNIASTYYMKNDLENALIYYNKALKIAPNYEETLINLAVIYYNQDKSDEAYYTLKRCNLGTANPNYRKVLQTVLNRKMQLLTKQYQLTPAAIKKFKSDKETLFKIHVHCVKNNILFDDYVIDNLTVKLL